MSFILGFFLLLLLILVWMLIAPIILWVDTEKGRFEIHWKGLIKSRLVLYNNSLVLWNKFLFWKKDVDLLKLDRKKTFKRQKDKSQQSQNKLKGFRKMISVLKSFDVISYRINLDTGDYAVNGLFYPLIYFLGERRKKGFFRINFNGVNSIQLRLENRMYKIVWALIY